MIEIKISIDEAAQLLIERMKFEMGTRKKAGTIMSGLRLENLSYKELKLIVDTAVIDTILFLPVDILTSETNLIHIITSTIRSLGKTLNKEEFFLFTERNTKFLIEPIVKQINLQTAENTFLKN